MDLKHFRTFVAVAECATVSQAAKRLHTVQPALSRQIIDLESELGITLFHRIGGRLRLTPEGEQLLGSSRRLLGYASSISDQVQEMRRGDSGVLKVTASPHMIDNVFSTFLHQYAKHYPKVQVKLIEGIGNVLAMIERGEVQLGTITQVLPPGADHFGKLELMSIVFSAVYNAPFKLRRARTIELRDLRAYPLLVLAPTYVLRQTFDAACRLARIKADIVFECSSPHTLLSLAEAGHGIAIIPSNVRLHRYSLKALQISHQGKLLGEPLSIFWDNRRPLPRYARDFCELLAGYIPTIIPGGAPASRGTRRARRGISRSLTEVVPAGR